MADIKTCCQCHSPNLIHNSPDKCPVCGHTMTNCPNCKTGRQALSPSFFSGGTNYSYQPRSTDYALQGYHGYASTAPRYAPAFGHDRGYATSYARPNMAGWWKCCRCQNLNNPALTNGVCSSCAAHPKCAACTTY